MRFGVVFNPGESTTTNGPSANKVIWTALESLPAMEAIGFLRKLLSEKNYADFAAGRKEAFEFLSPVSRLLSLVEIFSLFLNLKHFFTPLQAV